jgi:heme-degrading monooxygenase HmoA
VYARVTTFEGTLEGFAWAKDVFEDQVKTRVRQMPGNQGVLLLIDQSTGRSLSITLWEDADSMTTSRREAERVRTDAAFFANATVSDVSEYDIVFSEMP